MLKKIFKASIVFVLVGTLFFLFPPHFFSASAVDTTFQVNVQEVLSVSITTPKTWASGGVDTFLRNTVNLNVTSNNVQGFTASMISEDSSATLRHSSKASATLPTIGTTETYTCSSATCSEFPSNKWAYSLDDGSNTGTYRPMVGLAAGNSPIPIISRADSLGNNQAGQAVSSRNIYFGSKSSISQASGTYSGTVILYVVSGIVSENNNTPVIPETPTTDGTATAEYNSGTNETVRTVSTTTSDTTTTTTTINQGDATGSYAPAQGVTDSTSSNIYDGSMLTTGLAVTASVAAASGIFFFILAKRKKDDDEEETE